MTKKLFISLGLFLLVACSGKIDGHIYLDVNANNTKEDDESNIANLSFTVTRDDEDVDEGQTDEDGYFSVSQSKSGTYCVQVTESNLTAVNDDGTSPSIVASRSILPPKIKHIVLDSTAIPLTDDDSVTRDTETDCTDGTDDDSDGEIDCNDSDCSSTSDCPSTSSDPETNCSDSIDNDDDGDTDCDDSDCTDDSDCSDSDDDSTTSSASTESGEACDESSGFHLELDVPIAVDYSSGIDDLDDPSTKTVSRGDSITLDILYPASCTFDLITFSSSITPTGVPADSYDEATGQFNFNTAIEAASITVSDPLVISHDPIATYELGLDIVSDGSLESEEITITPTVTCPDDSTVTLQTQTIDINSDDDIDVTQSMSGTVALGNTITITTTITNNTSVDFSSDDILLNLSTPTLTQSQSYDSDCSNLGQTAECSFDLDSNSTVTLTTTFTMPASLQDDTTFEMTASMDVTANGSTVTFEGDTVSFSLEGDGSGS